MTHVQLDDHFFDHPKVLSVGKDAKILAVAAICYAGKMLTDGFIPAGAIPYLASATGIAKTGPAIEQLIAARLWDHADGGYVAHDYLDYNTSAEKVRANREAAKERARRGRSKDVRANFAGTSGELRKNSQEVREPTATATTTRSSNEDLTPPAPPLPNPPNGRAEAAAAESYCSVIGEPTVNAVAEQFRRIDPSLVPGWFGGMLRTAQTQCGPAQRPQLEEAVKVTLSELERRLAAERNGGGGTPVVSVKKFTEAVFVRNLSDALGVAAPNGRGS